MKRYYKPLSLLFILAFLITGCSLLPVGNDGDKTIPDGNGAAAVVGEALPEATPPSGSGEGKSGSGEPGTSGMLSEVEPSISNSTSESISGNSTDSSSGNTSGNTSGDITDSTASSSTSAFAETFAVTVYYPDTDNYLIPVTVWIEKQPGVARAAVNNLILTDELEEKLMFYGLRPPLPQESRILGLNIIDNVAIIDFNNSFNYENEIAEKNGITSLVYTLTEFENISGVKILVNGYDQGRLKYGTDISGVIYRDEIFINSDNAGLTEGMEFRPGYNKVDIYLFKNTEGRYSYLLPVSIVTDDAVGGEMSPETLMQFLLKTGSVNDLYSEMPTGAALLGSNLSAGTLTLNFNSAFIKYGGSTKEDGILTQMLFTLKQNKDIERVKILVDGEPAELPEGTVIGQGLTLPRHINDVLEK